jgi:hypothetical protein
MSSIQPSNLTTAELVRYAYLHLATEPLPMAWQHELVKRLEDILYPEHAV